jgi:multiple sugar transport system substrate-binding protein
MASAQQVELRISWWGSPDRDNRTNQVIKMFMDQNPNIKITAEHYANTQGMGIVGTDYWPTLNDHAAKMTLPDVMQQDYAYVEEWNQRGLLKPLDDLVTDKTVDLTDVPQAVIDGGKVGGKIVAVSLGTNTQSIVLDTNAFARAGVPLPTDTWTWKDFEDIALAIHAKLPAMWGFGTGLHGYTPGWKAVTLSTGKWVWSTDGKALGYDDDGPWIEHWKMILRLQAAGALPTLAQEPKTSNIEATPLAFGNAAMEFAHSNQLVALWTAAGTARTLKALPVPKVVGGKSPVYLKPSQYFSVTSTSKHPKEAALFISFFTNSIDANKILGGERGVPIANKVAAALKPTLSKMAAESFDLIDRAKAYATALPPNDPPAWTPILTGILTPKVEVPVMNLVWTPEMAVALFRSEATQVLMGKPVPDGGPPSTPPDAGAADAESADAAADAGAGN